MIKMNKEIKRICDKILYEYGLFDGLNKIGVPHVIGNYRMDMMGKGDLDIDVENDDIRI